MAAAVVRFPGETNTVDERGRRTGERRLAFVFHLWLAVLRTLDVARMLRTECIIIHRAFVLLLLHLLCTLCVRELGFEELRTQPPASEGATTDETTDWNV